MNDEAMVILRRWYDGLVTDREALDLLVYLAVMEGKADFLTCDQLVPRVFKL